jgi:hypothetical protein
MAHDQFTEEICVGLIIFGAATEEGSTIISRLAGIDRIVCRATLFREHGAGSGAGCFVGIGAWATA